VTPLERLAQEPEDVRKKKGTLHTPVEILQQPWLWRDTAARVAAVREPADAALTGAAFAVVTGAGSSLHAARLMLDAGQSRLGHDVTAVSCTDLMLAPEAHLQRGRKGVLLSLSRSGESPESVEAARVAAERFPNVVQIAITCNEKSSLARLVTGLPHGLCLALHPKSYDKGIGTTSSMTSTAVAGRLLFDPADVEPLAKAGETVLAQAARAEEAARLKPGRVVVLGTGPLEAAAQEGAHKVLELTDGQVVTMARSYLEFRHGPIAFLDETTHLQCLLSPDPLTSRYEKDFTSQRLPVRCTDLLPPGSTNPGEAGILGVVWCQMLALFISLERGLTPDRPGTRTLVNPIVQGVTIHPRPEKP
jgi:tagatose-6-phosphate ketose/aldose isomerase